MRSQDKSIADNETFVTLMRVAGENPEIKERLRTILSLQKDARKTALGILIEQMKAKNAPLDFIEAISAFMDNEVAQKTLEFLKR